MMMSIIVTLTKAMPNVTYIYIYTTLLLIIYRKAIFGAAAVLPYELIYSLF